MEVGKYDVVYGEVLPADDLKKCLLVTGFASNQFQPVLFESVIWQGHICGCALFVFFFFFFFFFLL